MNAKTAEREKTRVPGAAGHNLPAFRHMHPGVFIISMIGWFGLMIAYWLTFGAKMEDALILAVDTVFFAVFFSLPLVLMRLRGTASNNADKSSFADFLRGEIDTRTGRMSGMSALAQVAVLPVAIALGTMAIGIIISTVR
jgi:hypothetical protein